MLSASGLSGSQHSAESEADGHFSSPEPLDFQRGKALPGPFKSKLPGHVYQPRAKKAGHLCVPPSCPPTAVWPKPNPNRGVGRRGEGKSQAPARRACSCRSPGRKASRSGPSLLVGSVDTGGLSGRSLQQPPARSGLIRLLGAGLDCGRSAVGSRLT